MKTSLKPAAIVAAALIALSACKKNNDKPAFVRAEEILAKNAIPTQTFTGDATAGFTIVGEKGTKIVFPPKALQGGDGQPVSGTVTITLKEVLSKKDVMFSGVMTESNGSILESGGELLVKAQKDGKDLGIMPDSAIKVEVPKVMNDQDMGLFVLGERKRDQNGGDQQPLQNPNTWLPAPYAPFGNGPNSYSFNLPAFTWVNCDRFYSDPGPKTTITVSPVFADNNQVNDLQVMLVFRDIQTVITLPFSTSLNKFESYWNSLPVGLQADLVIIGKDSDGYLQFGTQLITISANQHINASIHRATQSEVDAFLATVN
ncbi:hypothetical protein [Pseudobacter ginsenosidimutans]|uniref:Lipoprotein n=1 Tax=Pseudobacter ginsenosidimutans TaxID=661488 RepID=A0A4Q7MDN4_9BACT|nr:hypothetical protein [Pseudobacter ginsenosidimutans]QEC45286.1 hypothetical protein FSB84_27670 [Pseudobacter ginsenosidimutans]RZS65557.1 hypothetical protein EV199_5731 [Pseudobacter ginsenosidimutans]